MATSRPKRAPGRGRSANGDTGRAPESGSHRGLHRLRIYAFDPMLDTGLDTYRINRTEVVVYDERVRPGPVGEYLEVIDVDPPSGVAYRPVDLNDPELRSEHGLAPTENNPRFHQQMVYAVAMLTIRNFERALGRVALWRPLKPDEPGYPTAAQAEKLRRQGEPVDAVLRLRVYPHALRGQNAFYSPDKRALLFGYFPASNRAPGRNLPGGTVYTCLSHDIIAHETTHALLDGLHPTYIEPSNPDAQAFHEAFADIVALLQHFTFPEVVEHQIARTRGDLQAENLLGELAVQFGEATGRYGSLRSAIGTIDPATKKWTALQPDPEAYERTREPHARGAILVAAVFEAFVSIYRTRSHDLIRLATGGTGKLPDGEIHPDLIHRLAREAEKTANHVLSMCVRALDYCPPVDITFSDFLRALITADFEAVDEDDLNYRVAVIEGFRRRGIYPKDARRLAPTVPSLSPDSLRWSPPGRGWAWGRDEHELLKEHVVKGLIGRYTEVMARVAGRHEGAGLTAGSERRIMAALTRELRAYFDEHLQALLRRLTRVDREKIARAMGLKLGVEVSIDSVRPLRRTGPDGERVTEIIVKITQALPCFSPVGAVPSLLKREPDPPLKPGERPDPSRDRVTAVVGLDRAADHAQHPFQFRCGCTLIIDPVRGEVRYCIGKGPHLSRYQAQQRYLAEFGSSAAALHFGCRNAFARLHGCCEDGGDL